MNPDPNAYRPSSLDLEDAARMKSESELESTQAHTMRNNRDLEAVMAIACLVITLSMVESTPFLAIIPFATAIALKNELQERARQLHTTATRLMAEAIQLRLRKNDGANDMDRIGADEFVKGNAIRTLIAARLTDESPAQAWVIAYRAGWNDALDFCIQAEQALDKEEDK